MDKLNQDVLRDNFEAVKRRIEEDGLPIEIIGHSSPLHRACLQGRTNITKYLIEKGATVDNQKEDGWCPLHLAALNGHVGCAEALLNAGADTTIQTIQFVLQGKIALDLAKQRITDGRYKVEEYKKIVELIEAASNPNIKPAKR